MAEIRLKQVKKVYEDNVTAVHNFNLDIKDGEFVVFVGPSGCGKSTTLRMIAGLEKISDGEIYIDNELVNDRSPKQRNIAMVFQSYALYPHKSVYKNMSFALEIRKLPKSAGKEKKNTLKNIKVQDKEGNEVNISQIIQEVGEEYNITITMDSLEYIGCYKRTRDFVDVWLVRSNATKRQVKVPADRVQDIAWVSPKKYEQMIKEGIAVNTSFDMFRKYYKNFYNK